MKKLLTIWFLLIAPMQATAQEFVIGEGLSVGALACDWHLTRQLAGKYTHHEWYEVNPLLGRHPSRLMVDLYFPAMIVTHYFVSKKTSKPWRRVLWAGTFIVEGLAIGLTYQTKKALHRERNNLTP